ncbi:hypothetical protein [Jeotgalibacillus sp. R-1-5s-1]|uniref:YqgU-like beta propeller domain-containing protein n=1 Tax=Jeotgalibacillus sp. R-1-5s-1 TaxID=2555897 RepID=UPI00106A2848|nr:hypothetical protein [Jeotgalibacillus sp. R-1-5s-1]TFD92285.1 hypothetical protein E2491_15950 [Jeotgalibacillus sp. R-1-5s-1]
MKVKLYLILILLVTGCSPESVPVKSVESEQKQVIYPYILPSSSFYNVLGWQDSNNILIAQKNKQSIQIISHDLYRNDSTLLFETKEGVSQIYLSPSKTKALTVKPLSDQQVEIEITDMSTGEWIDSSMLEGNEFDFRWNEYNETLILITSFNEEWEADVKVMDLSDQSINSFDDFPPFARWIEEGSLFYKDPESGTSVTYVLEEKRKLFDGEPIEMIRANEDYIVKTIRNSDKDEITYRIESESALIHEVSTGFLTEYDQQLLPAYELTEDAFIYFSPNEPGEYEYGKGQYSLMGMNLKTGSMGTILENTENHQISCNQSGTHCLIGHHLTSMINIEDRSNRPIILFEEEIQ